MKRPTRYYSKSGKYLGNEFESNLLSPGSYLVRIKEHSTSITPVNPKYVETEAALRSIQDVVVGMLVAEQRGRPQVRYNTAIERRKAMAEYYRILGEDKDALTLAISSYWDIVDKALDLVRKEMCVEK